MDSVPDAVPTVKVGTAGWTVPPPLAGAFGEGGSHLARFATRLSAVEINSSFYRPHRRTTYERWADTVPAAFRFSVKLPRAISHAPVLTDNIVQLERFGDDIRGLGDKLGCVLIEFPPKRAFAAAEFDRFITAARRSIDCPLVCEPRHSSWADAQAIALFETNRIARVAADPVVVPGGGEPGGWSRLTYRRLHGSPRIYHSSYEDVVINHVAASLRRDLECGADAWCIFDNTATGAATANALSLRNALDHIPAAP
jgi:uncharacterized protein YecE (DUF72 family)